MKYYIITGTSSGLGEALAIKTIEAQHKLFCISRHVNEGLKQKANELRTGLWYYEQDLTRLELIPQLMQEIFSYINPSVVTEITLINNAGVVEPVKALGDCEVSEIAGHVNLNLGAAIVLINEFIKQSKSLQCKKHIINISSGAASNPYAGWSLYCSTKAGIDMITRTVALEQQENEFPVKILSIAPGIVDTPMQEKVRNANIEDFPMQPKFKNLHQEGKLTPPLEAATNILEMVAEMNLPNGSITDLRSSSN